MTERITYNTHDPVDRIRKQDIHNCTSSLRIALHEFVNASDAASPLTVNSVQVLYKDMDRIGLDFYKDIDPMLLWRSDTKEGAARLPSGFSRRALLIPFVRAEALPNSNSGLPVRDGRTVRQIMESEFRPYPKSAARAFQFSELYSTLSKSDYLSNVDLPEENREEIAGFLARRSARLLKDAPNIARGSRIITSRG